MTIRYGQPMFAVLILIFYISCGSEKFPAPEGYILVTGGHYMMGCPDSEKGAAPDEKIRRRIRLSSFYMKEHEVTFEEYGLFCLDTDRDVPWDNGWGRGTRPVIHVNWYDAVEYCNWLSEIEGLQPAYEIDGTEVVCDWNSGGYRLPTEAEWEYACRAGTETAFSFGNTISTDQAYFNGFFPYNDSDQGIFRQMTLPVRSFSPNPWGFYDMHGNVWEWCWDWYGPYDTGERRNSHGPENGDYKVMRGGSWIAPGTHSRSASRYNYQPDGHRFYIGIRPVRSVKENLR